MSSTPGPERRRHPRYGVRLDARLVRGEVEVAAEIFNLSQGGCLLVSPVGLLQGELLHLLIPAVCDQLLSLRVVRRRQLDAWTIAALEFEAALTDETVLGRLLDSSTELTDNPDELL